MVVLVVREIKFSLISPFLMTSLALLEVKLVPAHCLVLVHDFGNANGTECDILLI